LRCPRCGNENSEQNRFCGMCGASLLAEPAAAPTPPAPPRPVPPAPTSAPPRTQAVEAPRTTTRVAEEAPSISGPSFLGLSDPAPRKTGRGATLSIDPHSAPGSNLDYLLDDEEQPRHWGIGKIFVILIALALAVGFGYLRWKKNDLDFLAKKPAAVTQNSTDSTSPSASTPSITPEPQPANSSAPSIQPVTDSSSPAATPPAASATPSATPSTQPAATGDASKPVDATSTPSDKPATPPEKDSGHAVKESAEPSAPKAATAPPKEAPPKPSPAKPADTIAEAQKYLYGRGGAAQDCDRGLRMLKPLANQANAKAMVEMGALYSAGLCTPRDLPTAYRWFAQALHKDPENEAIQQDLQKLWGEMTQPERQLAIKLSQ